MLKELDLTRKLSKEEYAPIAQALGPRLTMLQQRIIQAKIPVIILFEGPSAAGKGATVNSLILHFDARGFTVFNTQDPEPGDLRVPWLARFAKQMPAYGRMAIYDRSWYGGWFRRFGRKTGKEKYTRYFEEINTFERQLTDDGYLILKYFLYIDKKEQKKRFEKLKRVKSTSWRVNKADFKNLKFHKELTEISDQMLEATNTSYAPWRPVAATDKRYVRATVFSSIADELESALKIREEKPAQETDFAPQVKPCFHLLPHKTIEELDLTKAIVEEEYKERLKSLQKKLFKLQNKLYLAKIPVIIAYEGNDAAGKGGNIRRVASALDARGYSVTPIAAPTPDELSHQYLWRFWKALPRTGHFGIFDRTWYGRVLVERVEDFTPVSRINQAYNEINEFEYMLHNWGAIIFKFWLAIDQDEQLRRFEERENTPEKQWKITQEDWRNRDKWNLYTQAVNDMFRYTNTDFAPWIAVESNSKHYARIKTLETMITAIEKRL